MLESQDSEKISRHTRLIFESIVFHGLYEV